MPRDEALILEHMPLVRRIAGKLAHQFKGSFDDFTSAGMIGLIEAADRYDPAKNSRFDRWAGQRITGAIIDSFRRDGMHTRAERDMHKNNPQRSAELHAARVVAAAIVQAPDQLVSINKRAAVKLLDALPPRLKNVMWLYYFEERTDEEIGTVYGVTGSWICMQRREAEKRLRAATAGVAFDDVW